jgi:hypothetical protein
MFTGRFRGKKVNIWRYNKKTVRKRMHKCKGVHSETGMGRPWTCFVTDRQWGTEAVLCWLRKQDAN